jgi:hypothetical protein
MSRIRQFILELILPDAFKDLDPQHTIPARIGDGTNQVTLEADLSVPTTVKNPASNPVQVEIGDGIQQVGIFRGALNVHQADVHLISINRHFTRFDTATTTVSTASIVGATSLTVADTTGFTVGDFVFINDGSTEEPNDPSITAIAAGAPGTLTLDGPLDNAYPISSGVERVDIDMTLTVGTLAAPISFIVAPPPGETWHILRLLITATDGSAASDDEFISDPALTNGVVLRQNLSTGFKTISNWKTNSDMKRDMFDVEYSDRAGPSLFGVNARFTFKKIDFVPELIGDNGDFLEILIQDDLTGISSLEVHAQGHKVGV